MSLEHRELGQSGISVSCIGLGTVKFGRNQEVKYPSSFALPSDEEIVSLIDQAKSLGINLLDTAPAYGSSEQRLGRLLSDRKDWVICTKVGEEFVTGKSEADRRPGSVGEYVKIISEKSAAQATSTTPKNSASRRSNAL